MLHLRLLGAAITLLALFAPPSPAQARHRGRAGIVIIKTGIVGATVRVDGAEVGITPMSHGLTVRSGYHVVQVDKPGVVHMSQKITVSGGATVAMQVQADTPEPPSPALEPLPADPLAPELQFAMAKPPSESTATPLRTLPPQATSMQMPLEATASLEPPIAWYDHWWIWATAGTVVAGAGVLTYTLTKGHAQPVYDHVIKLNPAPRASFAF